MFWLYVCPEDDTICLQNGYLFGDMSRPCAGNTGAVFYYNFLKLLRGPLNRHTVYGSGIS